MPRKQLTPAELAELQHAEWLPAPLARLVIPMPTTSFYRALNAGRFEARKNGAALWVNMPSYRASMLNLPLYKPGHPPKGAIIQAERIRKPGARGRKHNAQDSQPPP
jgi:hypothetical protein